VTTVDGPARAAIDAHPMYVVGGRQRGDRSLLERSSSWYGYGLGVILRLDGDGVTTALEYTSKPGTCGPEDAVLFKSASRAGDRLYCCTQTEVIVFALPGFEEVAHVSLTMFNDVHHVVPTAAGTVLVAISGMELVIEMTLDGEVVREWNVLGEDTWSRHDPAVDYRTGVDLKPHRAHPNHVFLLGDEPFASRFELRDAISLVDRERRITIGGERIHDGVVHDGSIYFTTVDGQIAVVDATTLALTALHPLARSGKERSEENVLGWCRALHIDGEWCWVGFTRIRPTKLRQTVSWIRTGGATQAPTRIARYRMSDWQCDLEIDLEPSGLNAVFSILPA
jgi:hypothetical protein